MEEFALKAQILIKVLPYIHWPEGSKPGGAPLILAVVGDSPFGNHLDSYVRLNPSVQGRPLKVVYYPHFPNDLSCDLLFLCPSEFPWAKAILSRVRGRAMLTVADDERLTLSGVMVNLITGDDFKIHLVLNRNAALSERIGFSSLILRMAKIVDTPPPKP